MEIACPQCSMKYALDPRLLPPGGVPVQCTRCSHVFIAGALEPAPAPKAAPPARPSQALNSTVLYGTPGKPATGASPLSTQAFGAVPQIPQVAPVVPRVQPAAPAVAPAAAPASQVHKTQAFGAVPQVPPAAKPAAARPATARPPAAAKPATVRPPAAARPAAPASTQTPAVAPADAASALKTTQVFGAVPPLGAPPAPRPSPASSSPSGPAPRPAAPREASASASGPPPGQASPASSERLMPWEPLTTLPYPPPAAAPPGMVPRSATPERPSWEAEPAPAATRPELEPRIGVAATTPIELPDEILNQLDRPLSELMGPEEPEAPAPAPPPPPAPGGATLNKPLELPPELMNRPPVQARDKRPKKSVMGQGLLIAGGVLVLGLMALFTSPAWRSRADVLPHPVQAARDGAVAKLRRDDAVSQQDAIAELKSLSAAHPQSVELLAELGIALALHLDDTQVRLATVRAREKGIGDVIERLTSTQTPLDWQSRVNTRKEELTALQQRGFDMDESVKSLSADTVQVLKRLEVIPEKEPPAAALARLRARAMMNGTLGSASTPGLAVKLAQADQRDWSALAMAEYTLHQAAPGGTQSLDAATAMEQMRAKNSTYLRAYVLGARLGMLRHEPASAQALLDTVITLNPKHELAHELHAYLQELRDRAAEPPPPVRPAPAPLPAPPPPVTAPVTPEGTPEGTPVTPPGSTQAPTPAPEAAPPSSPPVSPPPPGASAATPGPEGTSAPGRPGG